MGTPDDEAKRHPLAATWPPLRPTNNVKQPDPDLEASPTTTNEVMDADSHQKPDQASELPSPIAIPETAVPNVAIPDVANTPTQVVPQTLNAAPLPNTTPNQTMTSADESKPAATDIEPEEPQFGLIDVVDAFTAMRHDFRNQTRENRELAKHIASTTDALSQQQEVAAQMFEQLRQASENQLTKDQLRLVETLIDMDIQLTRAIDTMQRQLDQRAAERSRSVAAATETLNHAVSGMSFLTRWLAKPVIAVALTQFNTMLEVDTESAALDGLRLMHTKLSATLTDHSIHRLETSEQPFNPETMTAISRVANAPVPPGHVAEQLQPAYFLNDAVLRFAQVRVAE